MRSGACFCRYRAAKAWIEAAPTSRPSSGHLDVLKARHHDALVRTTLTLDPDVARLLEEEVHRLRRPFKQVVNDAIRRGLSPALGATALRPYRTPVHKAALRPGIDPAALNRLADALEDEELIAKISRRR
jgi:hypothetical protein